MRPGVSSGSHSIMPQKSAAGKPGGTADVTPQLQAVLTRLKNASRNCKGWYACCPAHDDATPSLSVNLGTDGRVLLHCHSGCTPESVVTAIGLTMRDLFPSKKGSDRQPRIVATYKYRDEKGKLLFEAVRFDPKNFRQRRPTGGGNYAWDLKGVRRVPYRLPVLLAADRDAWVFVCEGEKDCDN